MASNEVLNDVIGDVIDGNKIKAVDGHWYIWDANLRCFVMVDK